MRIVQEGERIPVIEEAGAGAEDPRAAAVRLPGDAETRGEVLLRAVEGGGQALDFVAQAGDYGEPAGRPPLVLRPEGGGVGGVADARIAEGLEENVRGAARKIVERGEDEDAGEAVGEAGIQRDVLHGGAETELVCAAHERGGFDQLQVVFRARGIEQRRTGRS